MKPKLIPSVWKYTVCEHRIPGSKSSGAGRYSVLTNLLNRNYSLGVLESNKAVALLSPRTLMSWKCQFPRSKQPR